MTPGASDLGLAAVPVLLALVAVAWTLPGRPVQPPDRPQAGTGPAPATGRRGTTGRNWWPRRTRRDTEVDLGAVLTEVAARLQAGASPAQAWGRALPGPDGAGRVPPGQVVDDDGVPVGLADLVPSARGSGRAGRYRVAVRHQIASAQVACRMAHTLGAPLAQVLLATAAGVAEAGRAQADRRAALAAPKATARLLGWLPLAALVLGSAWGAAPLQVLLDGGWGTACLIAGGVLMVAGHLWSRRLVGAAERAGL